jgi:prepilin-type N-terminal cleavage/methylation domain-containing protein/prepilin-type processing-associated H-X9-DG protein
MRERNGFTLIELLVVISIIVLLVAILLPTLQRVKKQAKAVVCQSNLKQWGAVFTMYITGNDGLCPKQKFHSLANPEPWMYIMQDYSGGAGGISCCPMATKPASPIAQDVAKIMGFNRITGDDVTGGTFLAWGKITFSIEGRLTPAYYGSYGMNNWLSMPQEGGMVIIGCGRNTETLKESFLKTSNVKGAGNIPVYLDSWWWCSWVKDTDRPPEFEGQKTGFPCGCRDSIQRFCINRHDGFINSVFLDGSVRKVGLKELWRLKWHEDFNTNKLPPVWPQWMRRFKDY